MATSTEKANAQKQKEYRERLKAKKDEEAGALASLINENKELRDEVSQLKDKIHSLEISILKSQIKEAKKSVGK